MDAEHKFAAREMSAAPPGLRAFAAPTQGLRPGLTHFAPPALASRGAKISHHGLHRLSAAFAMLFILWLLIPVPAQACTYSLDRVQVSSDFRVIVRNGSTPMPGIKVEVYDERDPHRSDDAPKQIPVLTLITSQDGAAEIKNLGKGVYLVQTAGPGGGKAVYAKVSSDPGSSREISLEWPFSWRGTLKTKSLSGELVSNDPWMPFQNVKVQLWAAGLEAPLASEDTGPQGRFHFNEARPGIYVLHLQGRQDANRYSQLEGILAVELSPSAPDALASLSLRLDMTTCGIEYSSCPAAAATITTASRRAKVMDEPGVSEYPEIRNANYKLLDDQGKLIVEGITGHDGIAALPSEFVGKATLVVASGLETTVQQPLDLLPANESAPDLVVTMTVVGSDHCSAVSLEKNATPQ